MVLTGWVWRWLSVLEGEVGDSGYVKGSPNLRDRVSGVRGDVGVFTPSSWEMGGLFLRLGGGAWREGWEGR